MSDASTSAVLVVAPGVDGVASLASLLPEGVPVDAVVFGAPPDAPQLPAAVRSLRVLDGLAWSAPTSVTAAAVAPLVADRPLALFDSSQPGRDLAGWLSVSLDAPLLWAIDDIRLDDEPGNYELDRVVLGGAWRLVHRVAGTGPALVLGKPGSGPGDDAPAAGSTPTVEVVPAPADDSPIRLVSDDRTSTSEISLKGARVVVSVGRGIGGPDNVPRFRALAQGLGAALAATRVVVDNGWLPFSHQVGQTGSSVAPDVYLAFGISGAIQHLAGMRGSSFVVAVNTDPEAPICRHADLVIEADANVVADELLAQLGSAGPVQGEHSGIV